MPNTASKQEIPPRRGIKTTNQRGQKGKQIDQNTKPPVTAEAQREGQTPDALLRPPGGQEQLIDWGIGVFLGTELDETEKSVTSGCSGS